MNTVFIVDDDGLLREILARALEKERYRVRTFGSPSELLPELDSDPPELVISDIRMPGMNGLKLIEAMRTRWPKLPVIVMSGHITPDVEKRARALGVYHVLSKPIKDIAGLVALIGDTLCRSRAHRGEFVGFDRLRLSFLTGLSHELRTPLTAIKIALDGLFAGCAVGTEPASRKLVDISQRNVDRIIRLVENQLDLLQITLGEIAISRRLASLRGIVESAARVSLGQESQIPDVQYLTEANRDYLFTDPERLQGVIEYVLKQRSIKSGNEIEFRVDAIEDGREIVIDFTNTCTTNESIGRMDFGGATLSDEWPSKTSVGDCDFESRACRCLVESLGGDIEVFEDGDTERTQLRLPVIPDFDQRADFDLPYENLRRAALLSGRHLAVLECNVSSKKGSKKHLQPIEAEFLERCLSTLTDGDALLRCRDNGHYYLVVLDRSDSGIEKIIAFLENPSTAGKRSADDRVDAVLIHRSSAEESIALALDGDKAG